MPLAPGDRLGPYELLSPIGAGGMGVVWRAHDPRLGRTLAIKVLSEELGPGGDRLARFEQEARAASALNHPSLVVVHDIGEADGVRYIAMEMVEGRNLGQVLSDGPLPVKKAVAVAAQVAQGLAAAHARGIVHRDLKPENVMVLPDGRAKVLDFGLAKLLPSTGTAPSPLLTAPGLVVGTPSYMSPEQARGEDVDFRSDLFSFGSVLYEALCGRRAFLRETPVQTLTAVLETEPEPLRALRPDLPLPLVWVVERCLAKDPASRYGSTDDLARDLQQVSQLLDPSAAARTVAMVEAAPAPRARRMPGWAVSAAGAGLLAVGAVAGWRLGDRPQQAPPVLRYLTYSGLDHSPAVSRDGQRLAFSSDRGGVRKIWLKQLADGSEVALTTGSDDHPRFTPDGASILFTRTVAEGESLLRIPAVGGEPRRVVEGARFGDVSPDGTRLVYLMRSESEGGIVGFDVTLSAADGTSPRVLGHVEGTVVSPPRFSVDGGLVGLTASGGAYGSPWSILLFGVDRQERRSLPPPGQSGQLSSLAWLDPRRFLLVQTVSFAPGLSTGSVLAMDARTGRAEPVLSSLTTGRVPDVAGEGRLVWAAEGVRQNLLEVDLGDERRARWLTRGFSVDRQPAYTPDGKALVFTQVPPRRGSLSGAQRSEIARARAGLPPRGPPATPGGVQVATT
ncbi:serine/threonine-protein kinase [Acidobacteria bacterium ACD]|nr:serine/threonine-protein kinase [Acidobacteria bacterium ACD]